MSSEQEAPVITPMPNGPYVVKNLKRLSNVKGPIAMEKSTIALCRCGKSETRPFCDGTHSKIGFSSEKEEGRTGDKVDDYEGDGVTIHDNRGICAHAAICTDKLAAVFKYGEEPWIDASGARRDEIVEVVRQCPSGALSASLADGSKEADTDATVFVAPSGPLVVKCIELADAELGEGASTQRVTLCRCGDSKNKPFCDGSHHDGFSDPDN